jgi:hypothetical protein
MNPNVILFGWNRPVPGREHLSAQHFQDFMAYLQAQKSQGTIEAFEPVLLEPHGGTVNGFFAIKGSPAKLGAMVASPDWLQHQVRASMHLDGVFVSRAVSGQAVAEHMAIWTQAIPR